ncbi:hypothetical protein M2138_001584 [Dysgonomonadaceae bacterium PH5-43]|nr:hypothetical protein [Dysgonomonadaceae bacterium PH5-43]
MIKLLLLQYIAHLMADFYFQPQSWCDQKDNKYFSKVHCYHFLVVLVSSYLLSFSISFWWAALIISVFHLLLDLLKSSLILNNQLNCRVKKNLFFLDQLLHIIIISSIVILYSKINETSFGTITIQILFFVFSILLCGKPYNIFIKKFMEANSIMVSDDEKNNSLIKAGRIIGSLERVLSFILVVFNQFAAVGFIFAAKSLLRFKDTETAKTEYLLIGSLLSFGMAIILGIVYLFIFI